MSRILVSTGAMIGRPNKRNYRLLQEFVPKLYSDGIEFLMYDTWYNELDEMIKAVKEFNFTIPVFHCEKSIGQGLAGMETTFDGREYTNRVFTPDEDRRVFNRTLQEFEYNIKAATAFGAQKLVLHLWDGFVSDKNIEKNIDRFEILRNIAAKDGLEIAVENVICNQNSPLKNWYRLYKVYPDVRFCYDTKMSAFHNETMKIFEPEYSWITEEAHISHMHINDYGGGYMDWSNMRVLPIGRGNIDFSEFFDKFSECPYAGDYTLEATAFNSEGIVDFDMINAQIEKMRIYLR